MGNDKQQRATSQNQTLCPCSKDWGFVHEAHALPGELPGRPLSKPKFCQRTIRCRQKKALKSKHIVRLSACDVSIAEEEDVAKMSLKQIPSTFLCLKTMILKSMELNKDTCKKRSSDPELQQ